MIIAIVVDSYNDRSNGTSMTAFRFARELIRRGHDLRIVATKPSDMEQDKDVVIGSEGEKLYFVKERYIPLVTEISHKQHMIFGYPDSKVLELAIKGCDIVHFYLPFALEIMGVKICRRLKVPYIGAFHLQPQHISYNMNMNFDWFNSFIFRRFYKQFYGYIHHIHCPSKLMEAEIQREGYGGKKYVISNGFQFNVSQSILEADCFNDSFFHIASVGRFSKEKRQDILIKAIARSKYSEIIKLHLHGIGPRQEYLQELCSRLLHNSPEFGFIENSLLINKLKYMNLYVHPAQVESEAIACLEAVSAGVVPVIADSKVSATNQFALDSRSLFITNDISDLSAKIDYWIENKDQLEEMKIKYKQSAQNYALDKSIDKIIEVYKEAIEDFSSNPKLFDTFNPLC
ncbi:glycosyltransferase family 4 protein [Helicobacter muridarum]|uniref:Cholesterol alpha-glucosyltransferase n=1 Tax=Helicobacter muridarum TaxID=216 RepID=A0A099TYX6_9HELI|nr:glycosyltransferase [Helicobacter muridarum]TLE01307.1 glycosyltransferase family 4 protein [Helicobacter muridarum]STQ87175.1 cholesterol alpha-glucosyltransferase [Helicobacter muridarum]